MQVDIESKEVTELYRKSAQIDPADYVRYMRDCWWGDGARRRLAMTSTPKPEHRSDELAARIIPRVSCRRAAFAEYQVTDDTSFATNRELVAAARRRLADAEWDYVAGGSESETTLRRNRLALDSLAFRQRVMRDVSSIDTTGRLLGHELRIPVVLAPIGSLQALTPEGTIASVKAAGSFGAIPFVSSVAQPDLAAAAAASPGPKVYQLYLRGDLDWARETLPAIEDAGYAALCLTVDTAVISRRDRVQLSRWTPPSRRFDPGRIHQARLTWKMLAQLRQITGLPIILKGIAAADDARIAVEEGVEVIYVSNHGGRQLDHALGAIDTLPAVVDAVSGGAEVVFDGGVLRGSDVIKALALGAGAVGIGKLHAWAAAAAGADGIVRCLEILETEIRTTMALLGVTSLAELDASYLTAAQPTTPPHELSAFLPDPNEI